MECVRCVVTFSLKELHWEDGPGCPIHLQGPPVFLRACVLGQLQHSPLYRPTFPLSLHGTSLTFDRVLTNCSDPSLLKEVITGEHVFLEMVQVTEDYDGGRILARYEAPADQFLFPVVPLKPGQLRTLALSKSRKYQNCPQLTLTTSTAVTKLTIATPFPSPSPWQPQVGIPPPNPTHNTLQPSRQQQKVGVAPKDKLCLLLDSYSAEPHPEHCLEQPPGKIRPPNSKPLTFNNRGISAKSSFGGRKLKPQGTVAGHPGDLYHCCTVSVGPHEWTSCPRRSFRQYNRGALGCSAQRNTRSKSTPPLEILGGPEIIDPSNGGGPPPKPFLAGRVDSSLLAKRDFCGETHRRVVERERGGGVIGRARREEEGGAATLTSTKETGFLSLPRYKSSDGPTLAERCHAVSSATPPDDVISHNSESGASSPVSSISGSSHDSHVTGSGREEESASDDQITSDSRHHDLPQIVTGISSRQQRHNLLSKYLSGNGGMGMGPSPATLIENKLQNLIQDCCECRRSANGLGQDDMSEDDERLRASLSAEREDLLNKSAKMMPEKSVLVELGGGEGGRDYWSQKVAQFQGKHHRLVFNETMEKIYGRLYQRAVHMK